MRVFITGGSGLVGTRLTKRLRERGDDVAILTRRPASIIEPGVRAISGDPTQPGPWTDAVKEFDAVVNLVGEGVFNKRWTPEFKDVMVKSRVESTKNVVAAMTGPAKTLVSASAIGIYGFGDDDKTEASPPANDFLAKLCVDWEAAARAAEAKGVRVAIVRVGVVLDKKGGALAKMLPPFKMFVGGPIGSGKQWMSWIHHDDLVGLILFALDNPNVSGPLNGSAPNPATNADFSTALGKALGRPSIFPTPAFMLKLMLGEVAQLVTDGTKVLPKRPLELGYSFKYSDVNAAIADALK